MIPSFIQSKQIPHKSGVYIFKNKDGVVLYVGKAIDLNRRVASYFNKSLREAKTSQLVSRIKVIDFIVVESEIEALILEANLIKKYLPAFNIKLVDDKDYLYVVVTDEVYPRILTARKKELSDVKRYFGPFPSSKTVRETLKRLRRVFPWCASPMKGRACFYYHLGLCPGACVAKCGEEEYRKTINRFIKFMEGKKEELIKDLGLEMGVLVRNLEFEKAESLKKTVEGIGYLTQTNRAAVYLSNPNFLEQEREEALKQLHKDLGLSQIPERIECFDISNIQGQIATGSMVVLTNGEIDKSQYRKFKIRSIGKGLVKPNDTKMHQQMINRRLAHKEWPLPQLMLVDGGKGQVGVYKSELAKNRLKIPLFGLAKRMEWLYTENFKVIKLDKRRLSLRLLQKIRDEAHRFAIVYHRNLRQKSFNLKR